MSDVEALTAEETYRTALETIALLLADHPEYPVGWQEIRSARDVAVKALEGDARAALPAEPKEDA